MTDWKTRALVAEQLISDCKHQVELFYCTSLPIDEATKALRQLQSLLGVEVRKAMGVKDHVTREVEYVELKRG